MAAVVVRPRRDRPRSSLRVSGCGFPSNDHVSGTALCENQRPTPLLPAGKATRMRGSVPDRSSRCAATGPSRRKLLRLRPSLTSKDNGWPGAGSPLPGCAVMARTPAVASMQVLRRMERRFKFAFSSNRRTSVPWQSRSSPVRRQSWAADQLLSTRSGAPVRYTQAKFSVPARGKPARRTAARAVRLRCPPASVIGR